MRRLCTALVCLGAFFSLLVPVWSDDPPVRFRFAFPEKSRTRMMTTVEESVYLNGSLSHTAEIVNRALFLVRESGDEEALVEGQFQMSEQSRRDERLYLWGSEESSLFRRTLLGGMTMVTDSALPVLRGFPSFPDRPLLPGESWSSTALEVHDFREKLAGGGVVSFPVRIHYTYQEPAAAEGSLHPLHLILAEYQVYQPLETLPGEGGSLFTRVSGISRRQIYWDNL